MLSKIPLGRSCPPSPRQFCQSSHPLPCGLGPSSWAPACFSESHESEPTGITTSSGSDSANPSLPPVFILECCGFTYHVISMYSGVKLSQFISGTTPGGFSGRWTTESSSVHNLCIKRLWRGVRFVLPDLSFSDYEADTSICSSAVGKRIQFLETWRRAF